MLFCIRSLHRFILKDERMMFMCTAVSYLTKAHYFGRNLDLERGYGEGVTVTPRHFPFSFRYGGECHEHSALIGMAAVVRDYPLYFEATNEQGLSVAGLNFPGNAVYQPFAPAKINIAPFELIPYVLVHCSCVSEAERELERINVVDASFSEDLPVSPLHWLISDRERSVVLECTASGLKLYENPYGVLTNNPTFDYHLMNIQNYGGLHEGALSEKDYSLGMGAIGLPGDYSSASRFVRAVFVREKSVCDGSEEQSVNQFFHILRSVAMPNGCVRTPCGAFEYTRYSCCCNTETQTYYYTTYFDSAVRSVSVDEGNRNGTRLRFAKIGQ